MGEEQHAIQSAPWKDRSTGLVVFGVLQLCMGGLFALEVLLLAYVMPAMGTTGDGMAQGEVLARMMLAVLVSCGAASAWFITMGVGSILARRWARALILVSSWIWLLYGLVGMAMVLLFMGDAFQQAFEESPSFSGTGQAFKAIMIGVSVFLGVVAPGVLVLFYRGRSVKATCEARNPSESWTDAFPLPVLALAFVVVGRAMLLLLSSVTFGVVPLLGLTLQDGYGAAAAWVNAAVSVGLAWGLYKLKPPAWWASTVFVALWALSAIVTHVRVNPMDYYEKAGIAGQQLETMRKLREFQNPDALVLYSVLFGWLAVLGLALYNRRHFFGGQFPAAKWP